MMLFIILLHSLQMGMAVAQFEELPAQQEYSVLKRFYQERVGDYYIRLNQLEKKDQQRRAGENEERQARKLLAEMRERARQEQIKARKVKPLDDSRAFMAEIQRNKVRRENARKDYVQRRKELEKLMGKLEKIPEDEEFDINIMYEEEQE